jgi:LPPG:FO 2-phospho-L-lactate transferase
MVTFLAGGTGTPKLLQGAPAVFDPAATTVIANTGDDVELAGHLVCPDIDTVLFSEGGILDTDRWWGIKNDTTNTHTEMADLANKAGFEDTPRYLSADAQTSGRQISQWRRFSGVAEFMEIGDRDRAVHLLRTSLLDEGKCLSEVIKILTDAFELDIDLIPMSDDPVATLIHTEAGSESDTAQKRNKANENDETATELMHFQEYWVHNRAEPSIVDVEFRGVDTATPTPMVKTALTDPVVIGPSNPVTSIGPMIAMDEFDSALETTPVIAISPFINDRVFSGPAASLMKAVGFEPSTAGVAEAYSFADAFILDTADQTNLDRPVVRTDIQLNTDSDAKRVLQAVQTAFEKIT